MKKKLLLIAALNCLSLVSFAQFFIPAFDRFSSKNVAYIYLEDGTKLEGVIDDVDRKKGLIEEVTILPANEKKKRKLEPKDIKTMYLPASGYSKLSNRIGQVENASRYVDMGVNMDIINKGYAYFEKVKVKLKKDTDDYLMQIVNPSFSSKIKVFNDPWAGETAGFALGGGVKLGGGDDKSYYIQEGNGVARKIAKKEYEEEYKNLFGSCPALIERLDLKHSWADFDKHLYEFTLACE